MSIDYVHTKSRVLQWLGIILIIAVFAGAYWYFKVYGSTLNQSQNDLNTTNLVGLWSFNGDDISGTTAYDRSGSGNNGTLTNSPAVTAGKVGQALDFWPNGADNDAYVDMGDPGSGALDFGTGDFSVGFWMKGQGYVAQASSSNLLLTKQNRNAGDSSAGYSFAINSSSVVSFVIGNGSTAYYATQPSATAADNLWHHYIGVRASNVDYLYVDGTAVASIAVTGSVSNAIAFTVGGDSGGGRNIKGVIDEVRVYNTALTAAQIQSLYAQGGGTKSNSSISQPQGTGRLDSGLTGYWKFDDGSGTNATDSSTNGNTGTLTNGPTWTTGQIGGAVLLDGTDDYVDIGRASITSAVGLTLSAWIKPTAAGDGMPVFGNVNGQAGSDGQNIVFDNNGSTGISGAGGASGGGSISTLNVWYHIVDVFDGTTERLYLNGVLIGSATVTLTTASETNVFLGKSNGCCGSTYFTGSIDEARVYTRALSADEVAQLYRLTTPTAVDTSLKGYWSFNAQDMNSTTAYDRSGAGNTGTLTGGPTVTEGKVGQALSFDGSDDYIQTPIVNLGYSAGTISWWQKPSSAYNAGTPRAMWGQTTGEGVPEFSAQVYNDNYWYVGWNRSADDDRVTIAATASNYPQGEWSYYTFTWVSGGDSVFYQNGVEIGRKTGGTTVSDLGGTNYWRIGRLGVISGVYNFPGSLDEVRIYNQALTAAQIQSLYAQGGGTKSNSSISQPQGTGRLDSGLAGYWSLDNGSGTSATDSSTNGNTGTLTNGPTWTTGQIGNAVTFDGSNDYITAGTGDGLTLTSKVSVSGWLYLSANPANGDYRRIAAKLSSGDSNTYYQFGVTNNGSNTLLFFNPSGGGGNHSDSTALSTGQWYHVAVTFDQPTITFYVNGALTSTTTDTVGGGYPSGSGTFYIGGTTSASTSINGKLDEVRVYNRALSADEVANLYRLSAPTDTDTSLKGYWSFNGKDLSGTTAYDRSGAGNTGTLTGGPTITEGKIGQGLSFDGTDDYVDAGNASSVKPTLPFSVSAWVNLNSLSVGPSIITSSDTGGNGQYSGFTLSVASNGSLAVQLGNNAGCCDAGVRTTFVTGAGVITTGNWYHIATTVTDISTGAIYVNGASQSVSVSGGGGSMVYPTNNKLRIGAYYDANTTTTKYTNGKIDEVRLYGRALSAAEIASLYNQGR